MNILDCSTSTALHANASNPAVQALRIPHIFCAVYEPLPKRRTDGHVELTAFGLRHSCRELFHRSGICIGVELQVLQQRRVWFGFYQDVCAPPLFSAVSVLRLHTYPDTVDVDLLHIGRHLTRLRTLCLDINLSRTSGATYHVCALLGLQHLRPLTRLTRLGLLCMDDDITLALDNVMLMSLWPTYSPSGLNLALVTTSHVRVTLPTAAIPIPVGTLRLQQEAVITLCDSTALWDMSPSGFVLAPEYDAYLNYGARRVTPGRMAALLHSWRSTLSSLVLHETPYTPEVAGSLSALVSLSCLAWYPQPTGSDWGNVDSVPTVAYDSPDIYDGDAGDIDSDQKPAFMWLLLHVVSNLPSLKLFRFGLGRAARQGVGSGWFPDLRTMSLWQIASQCNTLPRNCILGLGDPDGTGPSAARTWPFMPDDEADNIQPDAMRDMHFPADRSPEGHPLPLLRLE